MLTKEMILGLIAATIAFCVGAQTQSRCPLTWINNHTNQWTTNDQRALQRAKTGCRLRYADAPCLKRFDKLASLRYTALCGQSKN